MCGRFTRMYSWRELVELYKLSLQQAPSNLEPRFNVCPTDTIDVIVEHEGNRQFAKRCDRGVKRTVYGLGVAGQTGARERSSTCRILESICELIEPMSRATFGSGPWSVHWCGLRECLHRFG